MTDSFERDLTPLEIEQRTTLRDKLDDERDDLITAVEDRRREIRSYNAARKKIESRLRDVRREIRSGKVVESPQAELDFPPVPNDDPFSQKYPVPRDAVELHSVLAVVLQGVLVPSMEKISKWHPDTDIFQGIANWARIELGHMNARNHPMLILPPRQPMPEKLVEVRTLLGQAGKKQARNAKVRPAGGTPVRTGQGQRKRARK